MFIYIHEFVCIYLYLSIYLSIYLYAVFTTDGFLEVAIESWPEWDLNPRPLNSVHIHISSKERHKTIDYLRLM